ncbi:MAG: hypothetical protein KDI49_20215, partial [Gammaproteobacteria bacterium]|nr:hypothetical protein [Gammaproteobacteria bacterium]
MIVRVCSAVTAAVVAEIELILAAEGIGIVDDVALLKSLCVISQFADYCIDRRWVSTVVPLEFGLKFIPVILLDRRTHLLRVQGELIAQIMEAL